jgi:hypothetical protein
MLTGASTNASEAGDPELRTILDRVYELTRLWDQRKQPEYRLHARKFLNECRQVIHAKSIGVPPQQPRRELVQAARALQIVDSLLPEFDEDKYRADEDLVLCLLEAFHPPPGQRRTEHDIQRQLARSNIFKHRAFREAARGELFAAIWLMSVALRNATKALELASDDRYHGTQRHLQYLRFHAAVFAICLAELGGDISAAHTAWEEACAAAHHPLAPSDIFPGYIWDDRDLVGYEHLLEAQQSWLNRDFRGAASEYGYWLDAVRERHSARWRFRNVQARQHLASLLDCQWHGCGGCTACTQAALSLERTKSDRRLGGAARRAAAIGLALKTLSLPLAGDSEVLRELDELLPNDARYLPAPHEQGANDIDELPHYFTSLRAEAKRLHQQGLPEAVLGAFIQARMKELLMISLEYQEGMAAIQDPGRQLCVSESATLVDVAQSIVSALRSRPRKVSWRASNWEKVQDLIADFDSESSWQKRLEVYETALVLTGADFPTIARVVERGGDSEGHWHRAVVDTLADEQISVESQFPLDGGYAYLPSRYRGHAPADLTLRWKDQAKWIPAARVEGIYELQRVELWTEDWTKLSEHFESTSLEYKERLPQKPISKEIAAFANTDGGYIIFGVVDPGSPQSRVANPLSLKDAAKVLDAVESAAFNRVKPPVAVRFHRAYPKGDVVIICRIDASAMAPHRVDGKILMRIGSTATPISDEQWREMEAMRESSKRPSGGPA